MAGDRRATMGNIIAQRDIEKVFPADEYSCVGIAGTGGHRGRAGPAVPGRARALREDRGHHAVAGRQGQPAGRADPRQPRPGDAGPGRRAAVRRLRPRPPAGGRIFTYDVTGGRYEEHAFHSVGSGSLFARGSLKKLYRDDLDRRPSASPRSSQALYDAADDDSATGGPDLARRIFPVVLVVTADGYRRLPDDERGRRSPTG